MKTIGIFKQSDNKFIVKTKKTESKSNYNIFCCVFKEGDKMPLIGRTFRDTDTKQSIMNWASKSLGTPESEWFKSLIV
jgi:hypothetical protein